MRIVLYFLLFVLLLWWLIPYEDTLSYKLTKKLEERNQQIERILNEAK